MGASKPKAPGGRTSPFYKGAARIERWMERPGVERFMDAATMWYFVVAGIFAAFCIGVLIVALIGAVI